MLDLRLYLVTDTVMTQRHGLHATIRAAVAGGATVVQLRDPDASDVEFVGLGRLAAAALRGTDVPLILNDRVHLVAEVGAQGAHVGPSDLDPEQARGILGPTAYLGCRAAPSTTWRGPAHCRRAPWTTWRSARSG